MDRELTHSVTISGLRPALENLFSGPEDALGGLIGDLSALQPALNIAPALCQALKP